jgi:hypothetical protein
MTGQNDFQRFRRSRYCLVAVAIAVSDAEFREGPRDFLPSEPGA